MQSQTHKTAIQPTFENLHENTLSELTIFYIELYQERSKKDFEEEIYAPLNRFTDLNGERIVAVFREMPRDDTQKSHRHAPMQISCAYCIQAMREKNKNNLELAWSLMAEARYWCGVVHASKGIEISRAKTIVATRKNTASKGGAALAAAKHKTIKEKVFKYARENRPTEKGWPSRRQAAIAIAKVVNTFEKMDGEAGLSPDQAPKTIDKWLKTMPDCATLFFTRKK
jgi:hypothetical protein